MFPILRQHWTLWGAWTIGASFALFANPWIAFGWAELFACVGSLVLSADRRTRRELLIAVGLPAIALFVLADSGPVSIYRLLIDWFVFSVAVLFGARAVDDQRELETMAGRLALGDDPERVAARLRECLADEIARARRYDRPFALLAIAPHPRAIAKEPTGGSHVMTQLAEARWVAEISAVLGAELHRYAKVEVSETHAFCVVPEIEGEAIDALIERLVNAVAAEHSIEVESGVARFPTDALGVEDLIERAIKDCHSPRLESVPGPEAKVGSNLPLRDAEA